MAQRWTIGKAIKAIKSGSKEDKIDIGRRYPLFATATFDEILAAIPDHVSVRQVEAVLRGDVEDGESEAPAKEVKKEDKKADKAKDGKKAAAAKDEKKVKKSKDEDKEEKSDKKVGKGKDAKKPAKPSKNDDDDDDFDLEDDDDDDDDDEDEDDD